MKGQGQVPPYQPPPKQEPPPPAHQPPYTGPNYQGFVFILYSSNDKTHKLTIGTQGPDDAYLPYTVFITGTWSNQDDTNVHPITGVIGANGDGIECSWANGDSGKNVLAGGLRYGNLNELQPSAYLDGAVTVYDANGNVSAGMGPGNVSGTGYGPPPAAVGEGSLLGSAS